jgi:hypothetical protein
MIWKAMNHHCVPEHSPINILVVVIYECRLTDISNSKDCHDQVANKLKIPSWRKRKRKEK